MADDNLGDEDLVRVGQGVSPSLDSSFRYTPLQHVRVLFTRFIQGLFYAAPAGCHHWEPDMNATELIITDENPINVEALGRRPAITFTRGPVQFFSLGLDDMMAYDMATGSKTKSVLVPGTMSVNCCSRSDLESENIAWIIAEHLWLLREKLMQEGFFEIGRQPQVGAPSQAGAIVTGDGSREWFCTTVFCPFQFHRTSQVTPLNSSIVGSVQASIRASAPRMVQPASVGYATDSLPQVSVKQCPEEGYKNGLPLATHPLDPSKTVTVRRVSPYRPGLQSKVGAVQVLPIARSCVEESTPVTETRTVKV
jgi:hypothetical protein